MKTIVINLNRKCSFIYKQINGQFLQNELNKTKKNILL